VGAAEAAARKQIDGRVRTATEAHDELVRAAQAAPEAPVADEPEAEMVPSDDPTSALERGEPVLVMPLRLRGKVARDWSGGDDAGADVEVDVQGKRLIVERRQVHRRNG
jgi:hypothetical protein